MRYYFRHRLTALSLHPRRIMRSSPQLKSDSIEPQRRLLERTLALQRDKLHEAARLGDEETVAAIERRICHTHRLIAEWDSR
jgi:hypothetical protein